MSTIPLAVGVVGSATVKVTGRSADANLKIPRLLNLRSAGYIQIALTTVFEERGGGGGKGVFDSLYRVCGEDLHSLNGCDEWKPCR